MQHVSKELFSEVLDPLLLLVSELLLLKCFHFCLELTFCSFVGPVEAVELNERMFISVNTGENYTLSCNVGKSEKNTIVWFKQQLGQEFKDVVTKLADKKAISNNLKWDLNKDFSLTIKNISEDDEGMYFCGQNDGVIFTFFNVIFLAVTDQPQLNISVLQTPVRGSVSPGESVTLQCTVLSEIRTADLRVLWFRAAAGQSFPEIIYTHQNSSSRQCEISSSTHSSVYNFSKNILDKHHTGTYYCAVAACGKIIVGNGASVQLDYVTLHNVKLSNISACQLGCSLILFYHTIHMKHQLPIEHLMLSAGGCDVHSLDVKA
uniref:Ig-like domain-containing protein n=1 Tax=Pygocentrus nattereri TaxID=42514 RepID=A0A3B4DQX8_PYGNA